MKKNTPLSYTVYLLITLLICLAQDCLAATNNWKGTSGTDWNTGSNWSTGSVPTSSDAVQIGVIAATNYTPTISSANTGVCASVTFGVFGTITLTVNGTLTVSGDMLQQHPTGIENIVTTLTGTGTINCVNLQVGNNTTPVSLSNVTTLQTNVAALNVSGNIVSNSATLLNLILLSILNNNSVFAITNDNSVNNTVTVTGQLETTNYNPGSLLGLFPSSAVIDMDVTGSKTATLKLLNATALNISSSTYGGIDFYVPSGGSGSCTVDYAGTAAQTVYTNGVSGLDNSPSTYQNITFASAGTKTSQSGSLLIAGNWSSASGQVDVVSNNSSVYFQGAAQILTDAGSNSGAGVVFENVYFQGTGTKTISSGTFSVASTGLLTMAGTATLSAGGNLTLISDSLSSATVAPVPSGTAITGNVNVQRFVQGSLTSLTKRGYRLFSSAVYTGSVTTPLANNVYDISYILNSAYISGLSGATNGFNSPNGTNPSAYIYREDIIPSNSAFTSGNFKGIAKINNSPVYNIGTQARGTTTNTADTTTVIPVGNGFLYYFIGNKTDNSTQTGSKTSYPFDYPESVTFTQVGQLNTGTVNVRLWFKPTDSLSYTTLNDNSAVRGFCLVGNPYASTINWEKFNRNSTVANSTIYGANFPSVSTSPATIWVYDPVSRQYDTYQQKTGTVDTVSERPSGSSYTGSASNMIASGQGFFIRASAKNQSISFRENAKTSTQPSHTNLNNIFSLRNKTQAAVIVAPLPQLRLKMVMDSINVDDIVINFADSAKTTFNENMDAEDLGGIGAKVSISSLSSDSVKLAINAVPLPGFTPLTIPLYVSATGAGTYQLNMTEAANIPVYDQVWLKDNYLKDSLNVINNPDYSFAIDPYNTATYGSKRFSLMICRNPADTVHLLAISAVKQAATSLVSWKTDNDFGAINFVVERSIDNGKTFIQIGTLPANGSGNYSFIDKEPVWGQDEYRLCYQCNQGLAFSKAVMVNFVSNTANLTVYPNPTAAMLNLKVNIYTPNGFSVELMNAAGSVITKTRSQDAAWQYNASQLLPGVYIINVTDNKTTRQLGEAEFVKN